MTLYAGCATTSLNAKGAEISGIGSKPHFDLHFEHMPPCSNFCVFKEHVSHEAFTCRMMEYVALC